MMKKWMALACLLTAMILLSSTALAACPTEESHRYGSWKTDLSPTCTRQGHQKKYCRNCDHWEQRWIAKLPHTVETYTVTKEPTCSEEGRQEGVCTECGGISREAIDKLPHTFGEMTVTKEPTCTSSGRGEYTCTVCGGKKSEKIEKLGHDWGEMTVTKEPTCKRTGSGDVTCKRCGRAQTNRIDKLEHVFGEWTITKEPEGAKKGTKESVCTLCGETKTQRFFWEGTLYEDMDTCEEVIRLQEMLRDLGYYKGSIRTGAFGGLTGSAVGRFQRDHGLEASQIADPTTIELIESEWAKATGKAE